MDLNGDGVKGTDLYKEIEYCNMSLILESYEVTIVDQSNFERLKFEVPYSEWSNVLQDYSNCLRETNLSTDIIIDSPNERITVDPTENQYNFMLNDYKTKIIDFEWENRVVFLSLEKELFTPEGDWKKVILYMEYKWYSP